MTFGRNLILFGILGTAVPLLLLGKFAAWQSRTSEPTSEPLATQCAVESLDQVASVPRFGGSSDPAQVAVGSSINTDEIWDFDRSTIDFTPRGGESIGRFAVEAALGIAPVGERSLTWTCLSSSVLAGNVFGRTGLVRVPPYHFQIVAGDERHMIFRSTCDDGLVVDDSENANAALFDRFEIRRFSHRQDVIDDVQGLVKSFSAGARLQVSIDWAHADGIHRCRLECPVKHINLTRDRDRFQIETGPVLLPHPRSAGLSMRSLTPAYLFIDRINRFETCLLSRSAATSDAPGKPWIVASHQAVVRFFRRRCD